MTNLTIQPGNILEKRVEIVSQIAEGTSGTVYKGYHRHLERVVAVKALHLSRLADRESVIRFYREATLTSALDHPNIVKVFGVGLADEQRPYIVMEYIDGKTLSELVRDKELNDFSVFAEIIKQICAALRHAHEQGVVHRDIKPSNVLINKREETPTAKVVDFGIAREVSNERVPLETLTKDGVIIGTPAYMSPEQCLGRQLDGRADIYSLGCLMYFAVSGLLPFESEAPGALVHMHLTQEPAPITAEKANFTYPPGLANIVKLAMTKDPNQRYQNIDELASDLEELCAGKDPSTASSRLRSRLTVTRQSSPLSWRRVATIIGIPVVSLALVVGIFEFQKVSDGRTKTRTLLLQAKTIREEAEAAYRDKDLRRADALCCNAQNLYAQVPGIETMETFGEFCVLRAAVHRKMVDYSNASKYLSEADKVYSELLQRATTKTRADHLNSSMGEFHQDCAGALESQRDFRAAALHYKISAEHFKEVRDNNCHEFRHAMRNWQSSVRCLQASGQFQAAAREQKAFMDYCKKLGANDPENLAHQHALYAELLDLAGDKMLAAIESRTAAQYAASAKHGDQAEVSSQAISTPAEDKKR